MIELLIVIAIIAILALIAIPNFLEAQTRSKVARVTADMRSLAIGLEAYYLDYNYYPLCVARAGAANWGSGGIKQAFPLSTPVAYLTSVNFKDPFRTNAKGTDADPDTIEICNIRYYRTVVNNWGMRNKCEWVLCSLGPDQKKGPDVYGVNNNWYINDYATEIKEHTSYMPFKPSFVAFRYDPTNGTVSNGDIIRWQRDEDR